MDTVSSIIVGIGSVCFIAMIYNGIKERRNKSHATKTEIDMEDNDEMRTTPLQEQGTDSEPESGPEYYLSALAIIKDIVSEMGCKPVIDERGWLQFIYQDQIYHVDCYGNTATIWKPGWACIEKSNPEWPIIREALNETNRKEYTTVCYRYEKDIKAYMLHFHKEVSFIVGDNNHKQIIKRVLDSFIFTQQRIDNYIVQKLQGIENE